MSEAQDTIKARRVVAKHYIDNLDLTPGQIKSMAVMYLEERWKNTTLKGLAELTEVPDTDVEYSLFYSGATDFEVLPTQEGESEKRILNIKKFQ